jgi:hypothetical protein
VTLSSQSKCFLFIALFGVALLVFESWIVVATTKAVSVGLHYAEKAGRCDIS